MKIKTTTTTTEIECNADELRQSNTVSDAILNAMRRAFNGPMYGLMCTPVEEEGEEEDE